MTLAELLPDVQTLSREDKLRLMQMLVQELARDQAAGIEPGRSYPVWSPDQAFPAAATLMQALEHEKGQA